MTNFIYIILDRRNWKERKERETKGLHFPQMKGRDLIVMKRPKYIVCNNKKERKKTYIEEEESKKNVHRIIIMLVFR